MHASIFSDINSANNCIRLRLSINYDGTDFVGWATQSNQRTVAGVINKTLSTIFRTPLFICVAGRTDSGVHASGQVAHIDIPNNSIFYAYLKNSLPTIKTEFTSLIKKLAKILPKDICIYNIVRVPISFNARFSALRRHYTYKISLAPYGVMPHEVRFVTTWSRHLNIDRVILASQKLLGLNDFKAFCRYRTKATTIRNLQRLDWVRNGTNITAYITADAFCWNMVRSLVGALLIVGSGEKSSNWIIDILTKKSRSSEFCMAPACGLSLTKVDYPSGEGLFTRNYITKNKRII